MKTTKLLLLIIATFLITNTASARDTHRLKNVASTITMNAEGVFWPRRHFKDTNADIQEEPSSLLVITVEKDHFNHLTNCYIGD
ncbi:MAG: hypothetical protein CK547_03095 [Chitinophagaceae bacterium]|nr:MAG: hypothetical protein CK547_03095 [Chitinophagaceae bacterium]